MPPRIKVATLDLAECDLANLRESGLTDETIRLNAIHTKVGALVFPYHDLRGRPTGFSRRRPHDPRKDSKGKVIKYEQPANVPSKAYFPVGSGKLLLDRACDIYITEGEKKALALSQLGLAAIGLGGVWCGNSKGSEEFIDDLKAINWKDRTVFIVFDYDEKQSTREQVDKAERRLAKALHRAGARVVYSVALPEGAKS